MTLSVMWRIGEKLFVASDSRISFSGTSPVDVGIKVMRLPILIRGTIIDPLTTNLKVIYDQTYAFSYSGSLVNAGTFKMFIEELLVENQDIDDEDSLSFIKICEFLKNYSSKISSEVFFSMLENGIYSFFFGGYCPLTNKFKAALFEFRQVNGIYVLEFEEILKQGDGVEAIGSGKSAFNKEMEGLPLTSISIMQSLNKVIRDEAVPSVGGDIQYGAFGKDNNFKIYGLNRHGEDGEVRQRYRGFDLYNDWNPIENKFWPSPLFIDIELP